MARSRKFHFKKYSIAKGNLQITLDMSRFEEQFQRAQYELDGEIMNSMIPFMPMVTASFIDATRSASASVQGSGQVFAAYGPQGRFLYEGMGMVGVQSGSPWARDGEKKVLVSQYGGQTSAKEFLTYTKAVHPQAQSNWFDAAKGADLKKWVKKVKEVAGGGTRGR